MAAKLVDAPPQACALLGVPLSGDPGGSPLGVRPGDAQPLGPLLDARDERFRKGVLAHAR
jgi:hypothetical protein